MRFGELPANRDLFADNDAVPPGVVLMTASDVAPPGWVMCDGQTVLRSTPLGVKLAGKYGPGNGTTTYDVPDFNKRLPLGKRNAIAVGEQGGTNDHDHGNGTLQVASHQHSDGTLTSPNHQHGHSLSIPDHTHSYITNQNRIYRAGQVNMGYFAPGSTGGKADGTLGLSGSLSNDGARDVTGSTGGTNPDLTGAAAAAEAPWQALNFIIKL